MVGDGGAYCITGLRILQSGGSCHQDGHDDGEHTVAEGLDTRGLHGCEVG